MMLCFLLGYGCRESASRLCELIVRLRCEVGELSDIEELLALLYIGFVRCFVRSRLVMRHCVASTYRLELPFLCLCDLLRLAWRKFDRVKLSSPLLNGETVDTGSGQCR